MAATLSSNVYKFEVIFEFVMLMFKFTKVNSLKKQIREEITIRWYDHPMHAVENKFFYREYRRVESSQFCSFAVAIKTL